MSFLPLSRTNRKVARCCWTAIGKRCASGPPPAGSVRLNCPEPLRLSDNLTANSYQRTGCLTSNVLPARGATLLVKADSRLLQAAGGLRKRRDGFERQSVRTNDFDVHARAPVALASGRRESRPRSPPGSCAKATAFRQRWCCPRVSASAAASCEKPSPAFVLTALSGRGRERAHFVVSPKETATLRIDADLTSDRVVFRNVFEMRAILEIKGAALAALRADYEQRARIAEAFERMRNAAAWPDEGVTADLDFHRCVASASGNPYIGMVVGFLAGQMRQSIMFMRQNRFDPSGELASTNVAEHWRSTTR